MKLIIAEKPALVSAIADALDGPRKSLQGSTYMTVGDYTLISVFGHLLELKEPEDYDECYKDRKNISLLPIYFDDWGLKVKEPDAKHKDSPPEERLNEIGRLLKQCEYVIMPETRMKRGSCSLTRFCVGFTTRVKHIGLTHLT